MNLTADCLQPGGQPSGENWDAKVVPESEMLIRLSYGDQASPVRAAWSGRPSPRSPSCLSAVTLTLLAVVYFLLICSYSERFKRWLGKTFRSLADGNDGPCQPSNDSGDGDKRGHRPIWRPGELSEQPFPDTGTDLEAYGDGLMEPLREPTRNASAEGQSPGDLWTAGAEGPSVHPFHERVDDALLRSCGGGNCLERRWVTEATSEGGATSILGSPAEVRSSCALGRQSLQHRYTGLKEDMPTLHRHDKTKETFLAGCSEQREAGEGQAFRGEGEGAGLEGGFSPSAAKNDIVSFFSDLRGALAKCSSLMPRLNIGHAQSLTWMILRLATLDLAVFVRVPSDIQVHRSELGSAIHDLASELLSYTLRLGMSSTAFLQGLHTFAGLIKDIDAARHEATSSSQDKDLREMGAHAKVCKTALMYYGAVLDGLLWATAAFPVEQTAVLVEQQLRVLQALCTMRAVQVSRDKACRILVFFHQTQRQFRPLVDIGTMKPRDKRWRTVPFTCLELDEAVARGGGVFFPPPPGMLRDAVQPWVVPSGPGGQANEELHATSGATDAHAARVYYAEFPPSLQGQDVSTLMQGAISYTSAELGGTLTAQATQRRQPNTSSAGQLSPSVARRWSRQRYKTAQTYPSLLESPQKGHSNPSVD